MVRLYAGSIVETRRFGKIPTAPETSRNRIMADDATNAQNWRPGISEDKLLNSHFVRAGYKVWGAGKIYHGAEDRGGDWTDYFPGSRGKPALHPSARDDGVGGIKFGPLACSDEEMSDHGVVDYGIAYHAPAHAPYVRVHIRPGSGA